jgi:hypothetical protein
MSQLSDRVLKEVTVYLGPATKTFLERQTKSHMNGLAFDDVSSANIPELAKWVETSAGLLIGKDQSKEIADKIREMK